MAEITIRPARTSDAEDLKNLLDRSWRAHWAPHLNMSAWARYDAEQPVRTYVDTCLSAIKVAERGGVLVGMYHRDQHMLHAIHVDTWAIGSGVGRALMADAEAAGARRLEVRAFNARALAFYSARGWFEVSDHEDSEMGVLVRTVVMER